MQVHWGSSARLTRPIQLHPLTNTDSSSRIFNLLQLMS